MSERPANGAAQVGGQVWGLWLGIAAFAVLMVFPVDAANAPASRLAAVAALMAIWWMTSAIPAVRQLR